VNSQCLILKVDDKGYMET